MAMRLYNKQDFENILKEHYHLSPTGESSVTYEIWKTESGVGISIPTYPDGEAYPDFLFNDIEDQLKRYGIHPPQ